MIIGVLSGLGVGMGLVLVSVGWRSVRRPSLMLRVLPYVRDVHPDASTARAVSTPGALLGPLVQRVTDAVADAASSAASVARRLDRLGRPAAVEQFRTRQLLWGSAGLAVAAAFSLLLWSVRGTPTPVLLTVCGFGLVAGVLWCDHDLSTSVRRREREMAEELPAVADLLALAVAAGESPVAGLQRVLRVCRGALAEELGRVLASIRTGTPVPEAFDELAARTGVPVVARFCEGVAVAVDRGTPLVDVLHAQAADVRESSRRALIEAGGRKEVAMMVPVVFLIMPVTLLFAFFPAWISLHITT